ncbi:MAG TPA: hypothetical protein VGJ45_37395 [Pseudonocardiaceae bacterium]|jgi:hypothetical protein
MTAEIVTSEAFQPTSLTTYFNNTSRTDAHALDAGAFNIWRNTFPATELPEPGGTVVVGGVPFAFPGWRADGADNVRCCGQLLDIDPPGHYDWIYLLVAAERRTEDPVLLHFAAGVVDQEWLRVSDFWPDASAHFGELRAYQCSVLHYPRHTQERMPPTIWRQRVPVARAAELRALRLPDNPAIHVFAMTLLSADRRIQR